MLSSQWTLDDTPDRKSNCNMSTRLNRERKITAITLVLVCQALPVFSKEPLKALLEPLVESHEGETSLFVRNMATGEEFQWNADEPRPTASLIKLATMVSAYRLVDSGQVDLDSKVTLREDDKVPGAGILTEHFSPGLEISVRDLIRLMIRYSDNTATNLVVDQIGILQISETMEQLGFPHTKLHSKVYRGSSSVFPDRSKMFGLGSTTARETVDLLEALVQKKVARADSCEAMLEHLSFCEDDSMLGRHLATEVKFAHKTGAISNARCDAGILLVEGGPILMCLLTSNNLDKSWGADNEAELLAAAVGKTVFEYFQRNNPVHETARIQEIKRGAAGDAVEMLQRTLNVRLDPSPNLSIDGDFGPATESAVKRFQSESQLKVTGVVDGEFWERLGPVEPPAEVENPEVVNGRILPQDPPDALSGPPYVTCRSWAILDGMTGEILWQDKATDALDMASTTKIMTAWIVCKYAQDHPEVMEEKLKFSERADRTPGSTAGLKAGETVTVRDALYGLLLPSGNDMAVALAEAFGQRLAQGEEKTLHDMEDPLELFVTAMNDEAKRLELQSTVFKNPHGLTEQGHVSSAADLARLSWVSFQNPFISACVQTRERGALVEGPSGYQRHLNWKNTNRLLKIEGYEGMKTGTTDQAGACLVSVARREQQRLHLVVLGASSSASRYVDSRNLYRWAWQQLETESNASAKQD
jgi:D-alanyl-D-alanine carboxypeptidase (penicillin-binding protein 5/6)